MPCFSWVGINKNGAAVSGKTFCLDHKNLKNVLITQNIELLSFSEEPVVGYFQTINLEAKAQFFNQLHELVDSGLLLTKALAVLEKSNKKMSKIISFLKFEVENGIEFSTALKKLKIFSEVECQLIKAGEESGNLTRALKSISEFLETKKSFQDQIRSLLIVPVITLIFFIVISLVIFFYLIPSFEATLQSSGIDTNNALFGFSSFLIGFGLSNVLLSAFIGLIALILFFKSSFGKISLSFLAFNLPIFRAISRLVNVSYFLEALSFMLQSNVELSSALVVAQATPANIFFRHKIKSLSIFVTKGNSLEFAMQSTNNFSDEILTLISVGQESGHLAAMTKRAAEISIEHTKKVVTKFIKILQPALMILLGSLIAVLIFSVYLPIFDLAQGIEI